MPNQWGTDVSSGRPSFLRAAVGEILRSSCPRNVLPLWFHQPNHWEKTIASANFSYKRRDGLTLVGPRPWDIERDRSYYGRFELQR